MLKFIHIPGYVIQSWPFQLVRSYDLTTAPKNSISQDVFLRLKILSVETFFSEWLIAFSSCQLVLKFFQTPYYVIPGLACDRSKCDVRSIISGRDWGLDRLAVSPQLGGLPNINYSISILISTCYMIDFPKTSCCSQVPVWLYHVLRGHSCQVLQEGGSKMRMQSCRMVYLLGL